MLTDARFLNSNDARRSRPWRRGMTAAFVAIVALLSTTPAGATGATSVSRAELVVEWNIDGTPAPGDQVVGHATLRRSAAGLGVNAHVAGLRPGGVYTFWWVVVQDDGDFPADIYVERAGGAIVGPSGRANMAGWTPIGDDPIAGFPVLGDAEFASLQDSLESLVRIEVAYHGQAADADDELDQWLADFWTGSACPPGTPNPNPTQPHCPVYYAATFVP